MNLFQFFQESNGRLSSMRLNVTLVVVTACTVVLLWALKPAEILNSQLVQYEPPTTIVLAMLTTAFAAKAYQKQKGENGGNGEKTEEKKE